MIINHNMMAMNTKRQMGVTGTNQSKSMEKLSSGLRINRAGDDAAGLSISEKMRGQIKGLSQASRNAQDGISLIQTAEGALGETHDILQRMRELAVQATNDTNVTTDREAIGLEMKELQNEISRIGEQTEFNTKKLLNGDSKDLKFQIGANEGQLMKLEISDMTASELGIDSINTTILEESEEAHKTGDILKEATVAVVAVAASAAIMSGTILVKEGTAAIAAKAASAAVVALGDIKAKGATAAITTINDAIQTVSTQRAKLGANQNRLEHTIKNLDTSSENLQASESRVRDVDMAKEMMNLTKQNILQQAAQSMLSQANQAPQGVLSLLR